MINITIPEVSQSVVIGTYIGEEIPAHITMRLESKMQDKLITTLIAPTARGKWMVVDMCRVIDLDAFEQQKGTEERETLETTGVVTVDSVLYLHIPDGMYSYECMQAKGLMRVGDNTVPTIANQVTIRTKVYEG